MPERRVCVDGLGLQYEGLFNFQDLYDTIELWCKEKGYDKDEKKNYEQVLKTGRDIMIETHPTKAFSDYAKCYLKMVIHIKNMKDVVVKKDGMDVPMNHGKINVQLVGYLITDYAGRWEGKPWMYFMRAVFDRWVYRINTDNWEAAVTEEATQLQQIVKSYLNMNRYVGAQAGILDESEKIKSGGQIPIQEQEKMRE